MEVVFVAHAPPHPVGGVAAVHQFANGLARRGHTVHLGHLPVGDGAVTHADLAWASIDERVHQVLPDPAVVPDPESLPRGEVSFGLGLPPRCGHQAVLLQGLGVWQAGVERMVLDWPAPKVCTARWLVGAARGLGVPPQRLVHVPYGLDHSRFRITRPVGDRPPRVAMLTSPHPTKRSAQGVAVLEAARERVPDLEAVVFGTVAPRRPLPGWIELHVDPAPEVLVEEIYNGSRIFLTTSEVEGFGFPAVEAMACGAALVTTDNGGSRDYADHGTTALVCDPGDVDAAADHVVRLLRDDDLRLRLVDAGAARARSFDWDTSAEILERFAEDYAAEPDRFL